MSRPANVIAANTLGDYLRLLRQQQGLTTRRLSIRIDRTEAYINRLELGKRRTDLASLYKLITALEGDFFHALICLCRDEGVPEEAVGRIAALGSASLPSSKAARAKTKGNKD